MSARSLDNKIAVVTGASRGIGRAIAERLAEDGATVAVNYSTNADAAADVVAGIERAGGKAFAVEATVGTQDGTDTLFQGLAAHGVDTFDVLVNNAGIGVFKPLAETTEEDLDLVFQVNLKGTILTTRQAIPLLNDGGRIVNISSGASIAPLPALAAYSVTKAGINVFTKLLAAELGPRGITANTVAPGWTVTDVNAAAREDAQLVEEIGQRTALGRFGEPEEIADVVAFFASNDSRWVTGEYVFASGGYLVNVA